MCVREIVGFSVSSEGEYERQQGENRHINNVALQFAKWVM